MTSTWSAGTPGRPGGRAAPARAPRRRGRRARTSARRRRQRAAQKELARLERQLDRLSGQEAELTAALAEHASDYTRLIELGARAARGAGRRRPASRTAGSRWPRSCRAERPARGYWRNGREVLGFSGRPAGKSGRSRRSPPALACIVRPARAGRALPGQRADRGHVAGHPADPGQRDAAAEVLGAERGEHVGHPGAVRLVDCRSAPCCSRSRGSALSRARACPPGRSATGPAGHVVGHPDDAHLAPAAVRSLDMILVEVADRAGACFSPRRRPRRRRTAPDRQGRIVGADVDGDQRDPAAVRAQEAPRPWRAGSPPGRQQMPPLIIVAVVSPEQPSLTSRRPGSGAAQRGVELVGVALRRSAGWFRPRWAGHPARASRRARRSRWPGVRGRADWPGRRGAPAAGRRRDQDGNS